MLSCRSFTHHNRPTSGLPREIEIWFVESSGCLYVFSESPHKTNWLKNLRRNSRVRIRIVERGFERTARVLDPKADGERYRNAQRLATEKYGWDDGLPVSPRTNLGSELTGPKRVVLTPGACFLPFVGTT